MCKIVLVPIYDTPLMHDVHNQIKLERICCRKLQAKGILTFRKAIFLALLVGM